MSNFFHTSNYNSPLPEAIYLDTSFLYEIYGNKQNPTFADECYHFSNRLAANKVIEIVSPLVFQELEHVILVGIYQKHAENCYPEMTGLQLFKQEPTKHLSEVQIELDRVYDLIRKNKNIFEIPIRIDEKSNSIRRKIITSYGMDSADAAHIVTALQIGTNSIAVVDSDFSRVPMLNIFTPNNKYFPAGYKPPIDLASIEDTLEFLSVPEDSEENDKE